MASTIRRKCKRFFKRFFKLVSSRSTKTPAKLSEDAGETTPTIGTSATSGRFSHDLISNILTDPECNAGSSDDSITNVHGQGSERDAESTNDRITNVDRLAVVYTWPFDPKLHLADVHDSCHADKCILYRVPIELRAQIFRYILVNEMATMPEPGSTPKILDALRSSARLYNECLAIFYLDFWTWISPLLPVFGSLVKESSPSFKVQNLALPFIL